jgi:hypothetical protein
MRCPAARNTAHTAAPIPEAEPLTAVTGIRLSLMIQALVGLTEGQLAVALNRYCQPVFIP